MDHDLEKAVVEVTAGTRFLVFAYPNQRRKVKETEIRSRRAVLHSRKIN